MCRKWKRKFSYVKKGMFVLATFFESTWENDLKI